MKKLYITTIVKLFLFISTVCVGKSVHNAHLSAGWYSHDKNTLTRNIENYLSIAQKNFPVATKNPKALIAPHAGHFFSGICAASAYNAIPQKNNIEKVIIIAPSHRRWNHSTFNKFNGVALPDYDVYKTVLGEIPVDKESINILNRETMFSVNPDAHKPEHSVEVQLPFLQMLIKNFSIVPLVVGDIDDVECEKVAKAIAKIIDDKTLIVVSSDFTHYGQNFGYVPFTKNISYEIKKLDLQAAKAIKNKSFDDFNSLVIKQKVTICGRSAIKILLKIIESGSLGDVSAKVASYYNSSQLTNANVGNKVDVTELLKDLPDEKMANSVSYLGLVFSDQWDEKVKVTGYEKRVLLRLARDSIKRVLNKKPEPTKSDLESILTEGVKQNAGAFVTLKTKGGNLRGCIGRILQSGDRSNKLFEIIIKMAKAAAFNDTRFSPVKKEELQNIVIDITVLTPPHKVASYRDIVLGKHGIILKKGYRSAVFLPQVPGGFGWDRPTTLEHLSTKAGLSKDAWRKEECEFEVFEGFEFEE